MAAEPPPRRPRGRTRAVRRHAGPPRELAHGLRDEHVEAVEGAAAGGRGVAQQPRRPRVVDEVVDQRRRRRSPAVDRRSIDVGIRADRRRVDQQVPAAARHRPRRPPPRCAASASACAASGRRACTDDARPARREAADDRARRSAGADDRRARRPSSVSPASGARKPSTSVLVPSHPPSRRRSVLSARAPARAVRAASSLNGAVTLAPAMPSASASARKSSKSDASHGM